MAQQVASKNPISSAAQFCRESWAELKKVHTPTRQETIQATMVVFVMVVIVAVFLGLTDFVVGRIMQAILT